MELHTRPPGKPSPADAETLAVQALSFLAGEPERLGAFLAETGLGPENVRDAARTPGFLPAVLDYLIGNEPVLVAFADELGLDPAWILAARNTMPGTRREP